MLGIDINFGTGDWTGCLTLLQNRDAFLTDKNYLLFKLYYKTKRV